MNDQNRERDAALAALLAVRGATAQMDESSLCSVCGYDRVQRDGSCAWCGCLYTVAREQ